MSQADPKSAAPDELAALIADQQADDRRRRLPSGRRVVRECDLPGPRDPETGRQRRRANLDHFAPRNGVPQTRWRGRSRKVALQDDSGAWHDTEATGRRRHFPVLLEGCHGAFVAVIHDATAAGLVECYVCGDHPRSEGHYCLHCDRCGLDALAAAGKVEFHGLKPDTALNPCAEEYDHERREQARKAQERRLAGRNGKVRGGLGR